MKNRKRIATISLALLPITGFCQDVEKDSIKVTQMSGFVVNALRVGQNAPFAFSNLDRDAIQQLNDGRDLPFVLNQTPSILVNSDAGNGVGYTDIRVRGTDNSRINFTINGIPVNDQESQGVFFVNFPDLASSSSSIQVQRGVGASTNGAGAFGASINVSNLEQENEAHFTTANTIASFGTMRNSLTVGTGRLSNGFNFDFRLSKIKSDGFIERSASDLKSLQFLSGWTSRNERTKLKFNIFTGKEKTGQAWNGVPEALLNTNRQFNDLGLKEDGTYYHNQTDNYQQDYYQLFLEQRLSKHWKLNTGLFLTRGRGFYDEYRADEKYKSYYLPNPVVAGDTITKTSLTRQLWLDNYYYGGIFNLRYFNEKSTINIGGAITQYDAKHYGFVNWAAQGGIPESYQWYNLPANKSDVNIYLKAEHELIPNLFATLDLQYRMVDYAVEGFRKNPDVIQNNTYNFFNPKAGLSYVRGRNKAYVSFAVANKEPNRNDFESGISDAPKAEKLYDLELGYSSQSTRTSWGANLYWMSYKDQLILTGKINDVGAYSRVNVDKSYRAGIELMGSHRFSPWVSINANATFSRNKISEFVEFIDDYDMGGQIAVEHENTDIALSPNTIAFAEVAFNPFRLRSKQSLSFGVNSKYISRQFLDNSSNELRSIDPYALLNLNVTYTSALKPFRTVLLKGAINNILNKKYESKGYTFSYMADGLQTENYYFPQAGINYSLTVVLGF